MPYSSSPARSSYTPSTSSYAPTRSAYTAPRTTYAPNPAYVTKSTTVTMATPNYTAKYTSPPVTPSKPSIPSAQTYTPRPSAYQRSFTSPPRMAMPSAQTHYVQQPIIIQQSAGYDPMLPLYYGMLASHHQSTTNVYNFDSDRQVIGGASIMSVTTSPPAKEIGASDSERTVCFIGVEIIIAILLTAAMTVYHFKQLNPSALNPSYVNRSREWQALVYVLITFLVLTVVDIIYVFYFWRT